MGPRGGRGGAVGRRADAPRPRRGHPRRIRNARLIFGLLCAMSAAIGLGGCPARQEPAAPPPGEPVRIVFKHQRLLGPMPALEALIAEFEAAHPGARVVSESLPTASDAQHQFYVTNLEGGSRDFDVL